MAKIKKEPKFDLINILEQKEKREKVIYEGAVIAFKLSDGQTGTWTISENIGVRLRLMQESKIQEKMMELSMNKLAEESMTLPPNVKGGEQSYCG